MIETKDIYWLAGLLEGEGCFHAQRQGIKRRRSLPIIVIAMCDEDVVRRAHGVMKPTSTVKLDAQDAPRQPQYRLTVAGRCAAGWMMTLYPLMGVRRQARIREVLTEWRQIAPRGKWQRRAGYRHADGLSRAA